MVVGKVPRRGSFLLHSGNRYDCDARLSSFVLKGYKYLSLRLILWICREYEEHMLGAVGVVFQCPLAEEIFWTTGS